MDKKTFLEELRSSLSVLQETELNDIMDEYEQHIDMKVRAARQRRRRLPSLETGRS